MAPLLLKGAKKCGGNVKPLLILPESMKKREEWFTYSPNSGV
jgi:hypothetical protein